MIYEIRLTWLSGNVEVYETFNDKKQALKAFERNKLNPAAAKLELLSHPTRRRVVKVWKRKCKN